MLPELKGLGWSLLSIRRPIFETPQAVLEHSSGKYAYLTGDGRLDHQTRLRVRQGDEKPVYTAGTVEVLWSRDDALDIDNWEPEPAAPAVNNEPIPRPVSTGRRPPKKILV
jgi:hypothetical protein